MQFLDVLANADLYVGKKIEISGLVVFQYLGTSEEPSSSVTATVGIGDAPSRSSMIYLYRDGREIICQGTVQTCGGFVKDAEVTVRGVFGKTSFNYFFLELE